MPEFIEISSYCPRVSGLLPNIPLPDKKDMEGFTSISLSLDCAAIPGCSTVLEITADYPLNGKACLNNAVGICPLETIENN